MQPRGQFYHLKMAQFELICQLAIVSRVI